MTGESFRRAGFWAQLVLLGMVDVGTIMALARDGVIWHHVVGLVAVNALLLGLTFYVWRRLWHDEPRKVDGKRVG